MLDEKIKEEIGDIESRIEKSIGSEYEGKKQRVKEKLQYICTITRIVKED